jgi:hypothetical protein
MLRSNPVQEVYMYMLRNNLVQEVYTVYVEKQSNAGSLYMYSMLRSSQGQEFHIS